MPWSLFLFLIRVVNRSNRTYDGAIPPVFWGLFGRLLFVFFSITNDPIRLPFRFESVIRSLVVLKPDAMPVSCVRWLSCFVCVCPCFLSVQQDTDWTDNRIYSRVGSGPDHLAGRSIIFLCPSQIIRYMLPLSLCIALLSLPQRQRCDSPLRIPILYY